MKYKCFILILLGAFVLTSCSSVPKPIGRDFTTQKSLEASQHWEILARDFANQTVATMMANPLWILKNDGSESLHDKESKSSDTMVEMSSDLPSIYLQTNDLSDFGRTFRSYLITEITKLGYPIAHTPEGAVIANWSVSKIRHNAERKASMWPGAGTAASLIGYGVYKIIEDSSSAFAGVLAAGVAYDLYNASGEYGIPGLPNNVPHTEVVLTFTVSKDSMLLSRETQAYYVNAPDFHHYSNIIDFAGQESKLKPVKFSVTNK